MTRHRKQVFLAIFILAVIPIILFGCGDSNPEPETNDQVLIETLQQVPLSYEDVTLWHLGAMRNDPDLNEVYKKWKDWSHRGYLEESYGVKIDDIEYLADAGLLCIARGDFDIDTIRDHLSPDFHRDDSYTEMEVWMTEPSQDPTSQTGGIILGEGLFVRGANIGDVKAYIKITQGQGFSMYDRNAADVVERLPDGIVTRIWRDRLFEGLIVAGRSFEKEGEYLSKMTDIYQFMSAEDADNAGDYFDLMEKGLARFGTVTLDRDGEFVRLSLTAADHHLMYNLFPN
ncbi:MAG: hypothetical protein R6U37_02375 [Dehalococcoidia bacterium]